MIDAGIITAPREKRTLEQSYQSALDCGFENIHIFAEPDVKGNFGVWHQNETRLGAFKNFHNALSYLAYNGKNDYIVVLLDDMMYCKNAYAIVLKALEEQGAKDFGYYAMITINHDVSYLGLQGDGWKESKCGWECWGGLFVMRRDIAKKIIAHPFYQNHLKFYKKNQQIDACVSETCKRMGLPMYVHLPSLAQHIGETSTIGHGELTDQRKAYKFNPEL